MPQEQSFRNSALQSEETTGFTPRAGRSQERGEEAGKTGSHKKSGLEQKGEQLGLEREKEQQGEQELKANQRICWLSLPAQWKVLAGVWGGGVGLPCPCLFQYSPATTSEGKLAKLSHKIGKNLENTVKETMNYLKSLLPQASEVMRP